MSNAVFSITALSGVSDQAAPPARPTLLPNSPNPFGGATLIPFGLSSSAAVRLNIVTPSGRLVRRLLDRELESGWHEISWDGTSDDGRPVAAGVYFYRFEAGETVLTRRMILSR